MPKLCVLPIRLPDEMVVPPLKLLTPVRVNVPAPDLISEPVPEIAPERVPALVWFSTKDALFTIAPVPRLCVLPIRLPDVMVVPPVKLLVPVRVSVPLPDLVNEPVPEITVAKLVSVV